MELDFIIDKLTNSIQNTVSGDSFDTVISRLLDSDLINISKKNGWNFNWQSELNDKSKVVYKLTIINNFEVIQGLLSVSIENDHVYMHLLENAPFNLGGKKLFEGVAGNLVAHACLISFQEGFDGFVVFKAKTILKEHYRNSLGAFELNGNKMIIPTQSAEKLIDKYFKH